MLLRSLACLIPLLTFPLYGEETPPQNNEQVPVVQKLVAEAGEVDLELHQTAPKDSFEKGTCLVVTGLIQSSESRRLNNFEIQRQEFMDRPENPDATPWKPFDLNRSLKVITSATYFQVDRLPLELMNPVVTSPLPMLKSKDWPAAVVHPDLRKSLKTPPENVVQFRVLDFGAKQKHFYRYRVRLIIADDEQRGIRGNWSKPSPLLKVNEQSAKNREQGSNSK